MLLNGSPNQVGNSEIRFIITFPEMDIKMRLRIWFSRTRKSS
jgi:hypothetical protein